MNHEEWSLSPWFCVGDVTALARSGGNTIVIRQDHLVRDAHTERRHRVFSACLVHRHDGTAASPFTKQENSAKFWKELSRKAAKALR